MEPDNIEPQITATWARTTAKAIMSEKAKIQLSDCLVRIKEAVTKNQMSTTINSLDDIVRQELTNRGFTVEYQQGFNQFEASYYIIKW
jgi:hypothetical protein